MVQTDCLLKPISIFGSVRIGNLPTKTFSDPTHAFSKQKLACFVQLGEPDPKLSLGRTRSSIYSVYLYVKLENSINFSLLPPQHLSMQVLRRCTIILLPPLAFVGYKHDNQSTLGTSNSSLLTTFTS